MYPEDISYLVDRAFSVPPPVSLCVLPSLLSPPSLCGNPSEILSTLHPTIPNSCSADQIVVSGFFPSITLSSVLGSATSYVADRHARAELQPLR
jgi:hypothetical protein